MLARLLLALCLLGPAPALAAEDLKPFLFDLLEKDSYLKAWNAMLAGATVPPWVKNYAKSFDGPANPSKDIAVGGETYTLAWVCKTHDCGDNQVYVLFAPGARQAWGLLLSPGDKRTWLGAPDPAIKAAIESGMY
jgi:inhibitor of lysozyme (Ivy)